MIETWNYRPWPPVVSVGKLAKRWNCQIDKTEEIIKLSELEPVPSFDSTDTCCRYWLRDILAFEAHYDHVIYPEKMKPVDRILCMVKRELPSMPPCLSMADLEQRYDLDMSIIVDMLWDSSIEPHSFPGGRVGFRREDILAMETGLEKHFLTRDETIPGELINANSD